MEENKTKKKAGLKIVIILIVILILVGSIPLIWYNVSIAPVNKNDNQEIEISIPLGTGANGVAKILKENNLIKNEMAFKIYVRLNNVSDLQAGTYYLKPSMKAEDMIEMLKTGKMHDDNQISVTFIEGKNINWFARQIESKTNNTQEDVYSLLEDKEYINSLIENSKYWFITEDIDNEDLYFPLEGYLFPDTYTFKNKDVTVKEIFGIMLDQMTKVLEPHKEDIENSEYSIHELLAIASIIELEGVNKDGRKGVSSVIYNRLDRGMALGMCSTTYYACKVELGERDLYQREINTANPYNTRGPNMDGKMPVGPISSVSRSSIDAAIHPDETDSLFFVSDKFGKLYFTRTNAEHERQIQELKNQGIWEIDY